MSFTEIPLQPTPNTTFTAPLGDGTGQFNLTTTDNGLFMDLVYEGAPVASGRLCLDRTNINTAPYLGLPLGLYFVDLRGTSDPTFDGFGTRYRLYYGDPEAEGGTTIA